MEYVLVENFYFSVNAKFWDELDKMISSGKYRLLFYFILMTFLLPVLKNKLRFPIRQHQCVINLAQIWKGAIV